MLKYIKFVNTSFLSIIGEYKAAGGWTCWSFRLLKDVCWVSKGRVGTELLNGSFKNNIIILLTIYEKKFILIKNIKLPDIDVVTRFADLWDDKVFVTVL